MILSSYGGEYGNGTQGFLELFNLSMEPTKNGSDSDSCEEISLGFDALLRGHHKLMHRSKHT